MHAFEAGTCRDVSKCLIDPMPPCQKEKLDTFVDCIMPKQRCAGRRDCLRTNFTKGITNATILMHNEWLGLLLTYLIVAQTFQGEEILDVRFDKDDEKVAKSYQNAKK